MNDIELLQVLANAADDISLARFRALDLVVEAKPDRTPVTDADKAVEGKLRELLKLYRPSDEVIGEEMDKTGDSNRSWIIDPIDGTANYLRGVPIWGTLIALRVDREMVDKKVGTGGAFTGPSRYGRGASCISSEASRALALLARPVGRRCRVSVRHAVSLVVRVWHGLMVRWHW